MTPSPDALDRLAAEYAAGTLRRGARRRFEKYLLEQPTLRHRVEAWERLLAPMAARLPRQDAPTGTWDAIERRLFGQPAGTRSGPAASGVSAWRRRFVAAWAAAASAALAAVIGVLVLSPERLVSPDMLARRTQQVPASYMAVLSDDEGRPALIASAPRHGRVLELKLLHPLKPPADTRAVLWARTDGGRRFALGTIALATHGKLELQGTAEETLSKVTSLQLTVEPGGEPLPPAPTQVALLSGPCVKVW